MTDYAAPIADMRFAATRLAGFDEIASHGEKDELSQELLDAILEEGGKFATGVLAPLNRIGDTQGSRLVDGKVQTPDGWKDAYRQFVEGGWNAVPFDPEFGGQGLPWLVATALFDLWHSSNMAFTLCPMLTQAAVEAVTRYGSDSQKAKYLEKMVSGEWTGTMQLTEPQAGSDLAQVRTKAVKDGDAYRITGQKIFITYGEHDLTENMIHMVLARTPDAPAGVKGISLFIVPKFIVNDDGSLGERNDVRCVSIEEKLGIHASPTAVMSFGEDDGAIGYLVGEENKGLNYMFTMMNNARLSVGLEGVGISERSYQKAAAFARDRIQSREITGDNPDPVAIVRHPDVRRMLMTMRALAESGRALAYYTAGKLDIAQRAPDTDERAAAQARVDLLIPIVKGWCTECGSEAAWNGVQVHGGMGYVEETGAAQFMRDAKIAEIYEGTNGIQANDLIGRKLARDGGAAARAMIDEMRDLDGALADGGGEMAVLRDALAKGVTALEAATDWLLEQSKSDIEDAAAGAMPYLRLWGVVAGGWLMARAALAAKADLDAGKGDDAFLKAKIATAQFFGERILPRALSYKEEATAGAASLMAIADNDL
ncbi:acyl-CoA dehydrogenase [Hyphococcus sp.]|uniref:acyl-CoA dehydrogenase n=1 Tax=Hyphococcus sp. TaxID=2038636 RepID=UPI003CCBAC57